MSRFLHYEACPKCTSMGRDSRADNLGVYSDGGRHCFSCGFHSFPSHYRTPVVDVPVNAKATLPFDFTREVPTAAWKWLLQWGLPYSYWKEQIGYAPKEERLVFLVGSPTTFSIGRYVGTFAGDGKPPRKWYMWGDAHKHCEAIGEGPSVVLVEDLISAHKAAGAGVVTIPLFGTVIHPCHLWYLNVVKKPVKIWLDKDQEGLVKKKAMWLQTMIECPVDIVVTDNDPKTYSVEKIKEILE